MRFAQESYSHELTDEMLPLLKQHFMEIAAFKDIRLDPDFTRYEETYKNGGLRIYTAREATKLVGYAVFFIGPNMHYKGSVQAVQDVIFMNKAMRRGLTGYRFIKWVDGELAKEAEVIFHHVKVAHDFSLVLERLGYEEHDRLMVRRVY